MRRLLLVAWLPWVLFLYPLPPEMARGLTKGTADVEVNAAISSGKSDISAEQKSSAKSDMDVVTNALWNVWLQNLGIFAIGLAIGVAAWRRVRYWQFFVLAMSIFYLVLVFLRYMPTGRAIPDSWMFFSTHSEVLKLVQMNFRLMEVGISNHSFLQPARIALSEILMPVLQVVVLVWLLLSYGRKGGGGMVGGTVTSKRSS